MFYVTDKTAVLHGIRAWSIGPLHLVLTLDKLQQLEFEDLHAACELRCIEIQHWDVRSAVRP